MDNVKDVVPEQAKDLRSEETEVLKPEPIEPVNLASIENTKPDKKPFWRRFEENVLILHTFTTLSGIFAGVALEGHAEDIVLLLIPRPGYFSGTPLWHAYTFVFFVFLTLGLSVRSFKVQERLRREDEKRRKSAEEALLAKSTELLKESADVRRLVQTMPAANFVNAYVGYMIAIQGAWNDLTDEALFGEIDEEAVKGGIRVVLKAIAKMFKMYDNASEDTHVAANLMLFIPSETFDKSRMSGDRAVKMAFGSDGLPWHALTGALLLHPSLSARAGEGYAPADPDPDITEMFWPIPIDRKVRRGAGEVWTVLPGAPLAWVTRVPTSYPDPDSILQWCANEAALPREVHEELAKYLKKKPAVHSFVSIPFPAIDDQPPMAVLNVHSGARGLLEGKDKMLLVLVKPMIEILTFMLELLSDLRHEAGKPAHLEVARELRRDPPSPKPEA